MSILLHTLKSIINISPFNEPNITKRNFIQAIKSNL